MKRIHTAFTALFLTALALAVCARGASMISAAQQDRICLTKTSELTEGAVNNIHYSTEQLIARFLDQALPATAVTSMEPARIWILSSVSDPESNLLYDIYKVNITADSGPEEVFMGAFFKNAACASDNPDRIYADSAVRVGGSFVLTAGGARVTVPGYPDIRSAKKELIDSAGSGWNYTWRKPDGTTGGKAGGAGEKPGARDSRKSEGVMTFAEYDAAPEDSEVLIEAYVDRTEELKDGRTTIYASDGDGAYLIYRAAVTEEDYKRLGTDTRIRVSGFKVKRRGEVKITGATVEIETAGSADAAQSEKERPEEAPAEEEVPAAEEAPVPAAEEEVPAVEDAPVPAAEETSVLTIPCGIEVPASDFLFPDSSTREYTKEEFSRLFTGNARERYFKSQIFIDEIFVRYGYRFGSGKKAPGKAIASKYQDKDWYQTAIARCPSQNMDTLMFNYMNATELYNINLVNEWQFEVGIEPY